MEKKPNYKVSSILEAICVVSYVLCYKRDGSIIWLIAALASFLLFIVMAYKGIKGKNN